MKSKTIFEHSNIIFNRIKQKQTNKQKCGRMINDFNVN